MRKPEQRLWDAMRKNCPEGVELERVENLVGDGMPDVHVKVLQRCAWVELKAPNRPKRETTPLLGKEGLRQSQLNWHFSAARLGLPVYTLIRDDKGEMFLVHCRHSESLNEMTRAEVQAVSEAGCWKNIYKVLKP